MTNDRPSPPPSPADDDSDRLAAEYVLGTLSAATRAAVEARLAQRDERLRRAVAAWEERLLPMTSLASPVTPSPALWPRIEAALPAAVARPAARAPTPLARWWDSLLFWRGAAAMGYVCAALLAALLVRTTMEPAGPQYVVVLVAPEKQDAGWLVQTESDGVLRLVPLRPTLVPTGRTLQFWTKADDWQGPRSLGLVEPGRALRVPLESLPPLQPNQLFELTLEPRGGSPTDRPTGPIQFIGRAVAVRS